MKTILDSIIKVEQDLQKKTIEAQQEANNLLAKAKEKSLLLEDEFIKEYEQEKELKENEIKKNAKIYTEKLMGDVQKEMEKKTKFLDKKKNNIKEKIISAILNQSE